MTTQDLIAAGYQARWERRTGDAHRLFTDAVAASRQLPDQAVLASALKGLAQIERDRGNNHASLANYSESASIFQTLNEPLTYTHTLRHVADVLREQNALERADACYAESLSIYRHHPEALPLDVANTLRGFALLKEKAGDPQAAKLMWQEARDLYAAAAVPAGVEESEKHIAARNDLH